MSNGNGNKNRPRTVEELYPYRWLNTDDLKRPYDVTVTGYTWEEVFDMQTREKNDKLALHFSFKKPEGVVVNLKKLMLPNVTQCNAIADVAKSSAFSDWIGVAINLSVGVAPNKRPTIVVNPPVQKQPTKQASPQPEEPMPDPTPDPTPESATRDPFPSMPLDPPEREQRRRPRPRPAPPAREATDDEEESDTEQTDIMSELSNDDGTTIVSAEGAQTLMNLEADG